MMRIAKNFGEPKRSFSSIVFDREEELISVVILNTQSLFLETCVLSVLKQDYKKIELIIIDNHSCNFSRDHIEEIIGANRGKNLSEVRIVQLEKMICRTGLCNQALNYVSGKYVIFLSGDDWFTEENVLRSMQSAMMYRGHDAVAAQCRIEYKKSSIIVPNDYRVEQANRNSSEQNLIELGTMESNEWLIPQAVLWTVSTITGVGGFDEKYPDIPFYPLLVKLLANDVEILWVKLVCVHLMVTTMVEDQPQVSRRVSIIQNNEIIRIKKELEVPLLRERQLSYWQKLKNVYALQHKEAVWYIQKNWQNLSFWKRLLLKIRLIPLAVLDGQLHSAGVRAKFRRKMVLWLLAVSVCIVGFWMEVPMPLGLSSQGVYAFSLVMLLIAAFVCVLRSMEEKYLEKKRNE